jgi:hypothetical protein
VTFTQEDLFDDVKDLLGPWDSLPRAELRVALIDGLRTSPARDIDDLDAAIAMAELLYAEYMAYGTGGGQRLTDAQAVLTQRTLRAVLARLGLRLEVPWRDFESFRSYWLANGGHGSWAARRQMVGTAFDPLLAQMYKKKDEPHPSSVAAPALDALGDASAIQDHLRRLALSVDSDPRLAVSVAKDLVESTAKLVLRERGVSYSAKDDLPALVSRAQTALRLHAQGVDEVTDEAKSLKTILGSLARLTQGVTELRNQIGVGHGRESVPAWVRPRHARLAAGAATTWCNLLLETLGDTEAPWRSTPAS